MKAIFLIACLGILFLTTNAESKNRTTLIDYFSKDMLILVTNSTLDLHKNYTLTLKKLKTSKAMANVTLKMIDA